MASTTAGNLFAKAVLATGTMAAVSAGTAAEQACTWNVGACGLVRVLPDLLLILLMMMTLDIITGVIASRAARKRLKSHLLRDGVYRKMGMMAVIGAAILLEMVFREHGIRMDGLLYRWTASWFIATEALSLYENAERGGLPMPPILRRAIQWLLERGDKEQLPLPEEPRPAEETDAR